MSKGAERIGIRGAAAKWVAYGPGIVFVLALFLAGPVTLAVQINDHHPVWLSHVLPTAVVMLLALLTRSVNVRSTLGDIGVAVAAVVGSAPLLAPLALVVLVLPAVSADVWRAAERLDLGDIGVLLLITVLPLFGLVARHALRDPRRPRESSANACGTTRSG